MRGSLLAAGLALAACGGGGSGGPDTSPPVTPPVTDPKQGVPGPLDGLQDQVSTQVFAPLSEALEGTPLANVVACADRLVTYDTLDLVDLVGNALTAASNPTDLTRLPLAPEELTARLRAVAFDLTGLLLSLADQGNGCSVAGNSVTGNLEALALLTGQNPLAGTPLEPLGAVVGPALARFLQATGGENPSQDLQLSTVADLYSQLNASIQQGLALIPDQAQEAPVIGGVLVTVTTALNDLDGLLYGVTRYRAGETQIALDRLLRSTLDNLLLEVLPTRLIEEHTDRPGLISDPVRQGTAELAQQLSSALATGLGVIQGTVLADLLSPVLDPIENAVLPALLGPITEIIGGGLPIGGGSGGLPDSPLSPVIDAISGLLGGLLGGIPGLPGLPGAPGNGGCLLSGLPILGILCPN